MTDSAPTQRMTADEFLDWAQTQPGRYELDQGKVYAMAPALIEHARVKNAVLRGLERALRAAGRECEAFPDGVGVRVDALTVYEPDASVRCGAPAPGSSAEIDDPVIVEEVLSRSAAARDAGAKLEGYFTLKSLRHYLLVKTDTRAVIHHRRDEDGRIETTVRHGGALALDPPGIAVDVAEFFPAT